MSRNLKLIGLVAIILIVTAALTLAGTGKRAWLGVYTQEVDRDLAEAFDLAVAYGAIINDVVADSPAEEAGLMDDDIIIALNGHKVTDDDDLVDLVAEASPGDKVTLTILRDGNEISIDAELGDRSDSRDTYFTPKTPHTSRAPNVLRYFSGDDDNFDFDFDFDFEWAEKERAFIGVSLLNISEDVAVAFGARDGGVLINDVEADSPAEKAGLKAGDIIVAIDSDEVTEPSDVQELIWEKKEGDIASVDVIRNKRPKSIVVKVSLREGHNFGHLPGILSLPDLPKIDFRAPKMRGLHKGYSIDLSGFDADEYRDEMDELRDELEDLKKELKKIYKKLE